MDKVKMRSWLETAIQQMDGLADVKINMDTDLTEIGIDSVDAVQITTDMEFEFGVEFPLELLWEEKVVSKIFDHFEKNQSA